MQVLTWLKANWSTVALYLGVYAAFATVLVRLLPKPSADAAAWKRVLHGVFIDWPAALPAVNFKGLFGLPVNVPYLTLSQAPMPPAPPARGFVLLGVLAWIGLAGIVLACMLAAGCGTAGGRALAACELGKLPQAVEPVISDVTAFAVAGGANWQSELESLGASLAPGQLDCIVTAIAAAWTAKHAALSPERAAALVRLETWARLHPAKACAERPRG